MQKRMLYQGSQGYNRINTVSSNLHQQVYRSLLYQKCLSLNDHRQRISRPIVSASGCAQPVTGVD